MLKKEDRFAMKCGWKIADYKKLLFLVYAREREEPTTVECFLYVRKIGTQSKN